MKMEKRFELTAKEMKLHQEALTYARQHREAERGLCRVLREIDLDKFYRKLGYARLFYYAVKELNLSESVANATITVARKTREIPELRAAVDEGRLSVSKASRIVSGLTKENASEVVAFALTHTSNEIDEEMARRNPEKPRRDSNRPIGNDMVELRAQISSATNKKLKRAQALLASKGKVTNLDGVLSACLDLYLDHHDPVRKAERAEARAAKQADRKADVVTEPTVEENERAADTNITTQPRIVCANRKTDAASSEPGFRSSDTPVTLWHHSSGHGTPRRKTIKAATHHAVMLRTGGRCAFINERGERCTEDRFLHLHHIVPLSQGGSDGPENLTCLCSSHHALVHQLNLLIDGPITWLRSPQLAYRA
jgi:hypothetical protein